MGSNEQKYVTWDKSLQVIVLQTTVLTSGAHSH